MVKHTTPYASLGFSLVEVMVALLIGLAGMVAIYQAYSLAETRKRTVTGSSDAQVSGNLSLYAIQRSLAMAGYGMNNDQLLNCTVNASDTARPITTFSFPLRPVWIQHSVGAPDSIAFMYSGSALATNDGVQLNSGTLTAAGAPLPTIGATSFTVNDLVIAAETAATPCVLAQVTAISANTVTRASNSHNPAGGFAVSFGANARLFNMGLAQRNPANPSNKQFTVQQFTVNPNDASLHLQSLFPYDASANISINGVSWSDSIIANGVLDLQAVYGWDTDGDNVVSPAEYSVTPPANPPSAAQWRQLRSIRLALLVRSGNFEKDEVTAALPSWSVGAFNAPQDAQWKHYRYRVYETEIPLRNLIW